MNTFLRFTVLSLLGGLILVSCSRKKNSFLNRNYHAVTTKFNTMHNGEVAFEKGRAELDATFNDNYWEILPVERIETFDDITRPGESKNPNFERAEEKAAKAIQKHSMKIDGKEYNPQVDESFIMLGKARYFEQRFIPALEAFNYVLAYYPTSNSIAQAKIWKEKTNIRLDNNELAIKNLQKLLKVEELKDQDFADATAMLSQAFMNLEIYDTALAYIKDAAVYTKKNEERGRYNYIKGQLYNKLNYSDSANMAFDAVIAMNRRIPRKYMINAHLEKVRNFNYTTGDTLALLEFLNKLEANRENRPFLDRIYYRKAEFYQNLGNKDSAVFLYNKSLRTNSQDRYLVSRDYLALAEYNFENAQYQEAGSYYDSTMGQLNDKSREFRRIKKKRDNLTDVIKYEGIVQRNDSIINLTKLNDEDLKSFFEEYIVAQREKAIKDSIAAAESIRNNQFFNNNNTNSRFGSGPPGGGVNGLSVGGNSFSARTGGANRDVNQVGQFYFYNPTAVAYGKQNFTKRWGNRKLEDDWRLSAKASLSDGEGVPTTIAGTQGGEEASQLSVESLMASVPRDEAVIDSLSKDRDMAYYQLGLIYKEKFKEYPLSVDRLETLLTHDPEDRLILPSKYYMYQAYTAMDAFAKADSYKNDIITNYPDSRYASILRNPNIALEQDAGSPEAVYNTLFRKLVAQDYKSLLTDLDTYIDQFFGDPFIPKFELLKATAIGRYQGHEAYEKALNFVALTYPRSEEGKKAQELLQKSIPSLRFKTFAPDEESAYWKLVFPFDSAAQEATATFKKKLDEAFEELGYTQYSTSLDVYNEFQNFVVVHYINGRSRAGGLGELLKINKKYKITRPSITISSKNYKLVQVHKNMDAYLAQEQESN